MLPPLCLCNEITRVHIATQVVCILSRVEQSKTTNTGHLASMVLDDCSLRVRGDDTAPLRTDDLTTEDRRTFVVFPADDARVLDRALVEEDPRPLRLVFPDATWKQARRIMKRVPALAAAPKIVLSAMNPSKYQLRKHARAGGLCTYEAIMEALAVIEGEHVRAPLEHLFRLFVDRTLWSRGELKGEDVYGGVSREALDYKGSESKGVLPLRWGKYRRIGGTA